MICIKLDKKLLKTPKIWTFEDFLGFF